MAGPTLKKPRILLITRNLPPLTGGMERLILHAATGIAKYASLTVIGPRGCTEHLGSDIKVVEVPDSAPPFLFFATFKALRLCRSNTFDLIIGGSGLAAPPVILAGMRHRTKTLLFLHGLDLVVNHPVYQLSFIPCIRRASHVIANSQNTRRLACEKGVQDERVTVINPGTSLPQPVPADVTAAFRDKYAFTFPHTLLFVGRMTQRKGLSYFIQNIFPLITQSLPDTGLIVVGESPQDSLNKRGEGTAVMDAVKASGLEKSVVFLGKLDDSELVTAYSLASVQIFPLLETPGDVEGFGMVAVEAAACGTPTVAFSVGGVADAIAPENGYLVTAGQYQEFARRILQILQEGSPSDQSCRRHAAEYAWPQFDRKLKNVLSSIITTATGNDPAGQATS